MATVLCLSSQVARGYVGGSATRVALERLGHEVWLVPTVILSNHPGHALFAGEQVPPGRLRAVLDALEANGWLEEADAVLTGYMPTPEHVSLAARACEMVRAAHPGALLVCDPILGDDPHGLYLDAAAAEALRDTLLPQADIATPNRFELAWLTGAAVSGEAQALGAAGALGPATVLATSVPGGKADTLLNLLTTPEGAWRAATPRRAMAPQGAGDLTAALYLGYLLEGAEPEDALARAAAGTQAALEASGGADELRLPQSADAWAGARAWPVAPAGA